MTTRVISDLRYDQRKSQGRPNKTGNGNKKLGPVLTAIVNGKKIEGFNYLASDWRGFTKAQKDKCIMLAKKFCVYRCLRKRSKKTVGIP